MTFTPPTVQRSLRLWFVLTCLLLALPLPVQAQGVNRLERIQVLPHGAVTRIHFSFVSPPDYRLERTPGRVRLRVNGASSSPFGKWRGFSNPQLAGIFCNRRSNALRIEVGLKGDPAVQVLPPANPNVLTLEIGGRGKLTQTEIVPGREAILAGTEKFVREYAGPLRSGLPFVATNPEQLKVLISSSDDLKLFQLGEMLLYRENGEQAKQVFATFLNKGPAELQALAWLRLGNALSLLDKNEEAVKAYRQGETLWPAYLDRAPELVQSYAEARAKAGDYAGGRSQLVSLVNRLIGTAYVGPLLNRLAEITARHGDLALALEIYRSVLLQAPGSPAAGWATMKIADQQMFSTPKDRYLELSRHYQAIYEAPGDLALRDEALFKITLLQALYGPTPQALEAILTYDRRFPHGIFSTIVKKMREELLLITYGDLYAAHDEAGLMQLAQDNREYLARCFSDPQFVTRLSHAFHSQGKIAKEITLFGYLLDKSFTADAASFMLLHLVDDSFALGNVALADSSARLFVARFPAHPQAQRLHELLGRIAFDGRDYKGVSARLAFLNGKGKKAELPESDYYLGKALAATGDQRGAEKSLARFTVQAPATSPLLADSYASLGSARVALKDPKGALTAYRQGEQLSKGEAADQFLYKMGELYLQLRQVPQAIAAWEKAAAHKEGTWGKLAAESLSDLKWRLKMSRQLP